MDKKIPDTAIGILEHNGQFVSIGKDGKFRVGTREVDDSNIHREMAIARGESSPNDIWDASWMSISSKGRDYRQELKDLKEFLSFKGFQLDEKELKEFIESRRLADKMIEDTQVKGFAANFKLYEQTGAAYANLGAIAKVKL